MWPTPGSPAPTATSTDTCGRCSSRTPARRASCSPSSPRNARASTDRPRLRCPPAPPSRRPECDAAAALGLGPGAGPRSGITQRVAQAAGRRLGRHDADVALGAGLGSTPPGQDLGLGARGEHLVEAAGEVADGRILLGPGVGRTAGLADGVARLAAGGVLVGDEHVAGAADGDGRVRADDRLALGHHAVVHDLGGARGRSARDLVVEQRLVEAVHVGHVPVARRIDEEAGPDADVTGVDRAVRPRRLTVDDHRGLPLAALLAGRHQVAVDPVVEDESEAALGLGERYVEPRALRESVGVDRVEDLLAALFTGGVEALLTGAALRRAARGRRLALESVGAARSARAHERATGRGFLEIDVLEAPIRRGRRALLLRRGHPHAALASAVRARFDEEVGDHGLAADDQLLGVAPEIAVGLLLDRVRRPALAVRSGELERAVLRVEVGDLRPVLCDGDAGPQAHVVAGIGQARSKSTRVVEERIGGSTGGARLELGIDLGQTVDALPRDLLAIPFADHQIAPDVLGLAVLDGAAVAEVVVACDPDAAVAAHRGGGVGAHQSRLEGLAAVDVWALLGALLGGLFLAAAGAAGEGRGDGHQREAADDAGAMPPSRVARTASPAQRHGDADPGGGEESGPGTQSARRATGDLAAAGAPGSAQRSVGLAVDERVALLRDVALLVHGLHPDPSGAFDGQARQGIGGRPFTKLGVVQRPAHLHVGGRGDDIEDLEIQDPLLRALGKVQVRRRLVDADLGDCRASIHGRGLTDDAGTHLDLVLHLDRQLGGTHLDPTLRAPGVPDAAIQAVLPLQRPRAVVAAAAQRELDLRGVVLADGRQREPCALDALARDLHRGVELLG